MRRQFTNNSVEDLKNLLLMQPWNEIFNHSDVTSSLKAFMDIFLDYRLYKKYQTIYKRV
jgi:hypothetical protein